MKRYKKLIAVLTAAIVMAMPLTAAATGAGDVMKGLSLVENDNSEPLNPYVNLIVPTMADDTYEVHLDPEGLLRRFDPVAFPSQDRVLFKSDPGAKITINTNSAFSDGALYQITYVEDNAAFLAAINGLDLQSDGTFAGAPLWTVGTFAVWVPVKERLTDAEKLDNDGEGKFVFLDATNAAQYLEFIDGDGELLEEEEGDTVYGTVGTFGTARVSLRPLTDKDGKPIFDGNIYKQAAPFTIPEADYFDYFKLGTENGSFGTFSVVGTGSLPGYLLHSSGTYMTIEDALDYTYDPLTSTGTFGGKWVADWTSFSDAFKYEGSRRLTYSGTSFEAKVITKSSESYDLDIELNVVGFEGLTFMSTDSAADGMVYFELQATTGSFGGGGTPMAAPAKLSTGTWGLSAEDDQIDASAVLSMNMTAGTFTELTYMLKDSLDPTRSNDYNRFYAHSDPYDYEEVTFRIVGSLYNSVGTLAGTDYPAGRDAAWDKYVRDLRAGDTMMPYLELVFNLTAVKDKVVVTPPEPDPEPGTYSWNDISSGPLTSGANFATTSTIPELIGKTMTSAVVHTNTEGVPGTTTLTVVTSSPSANNEARNNNGTLVIRVGAGVANNWTKMVLTVAGGDVVTINR